MQQIIKVRVNAVVMQLKRTNNHVLFSTTLNKYSTTSAYRAPPGKSGHAEGIVKSTPLPHGSLKLPGSAPWDSIFNTAVSSETSELLVVESSCPVDTRMERGASTEQPPTDVLEEHAENVGKRDSHADTSAETGKSEGADSVKFSDSIQIDQLEKDGSAEKKSGNLASPSVDMPGFSALTTIVDTSSVAINIEREGGSQEHYQIVQS